MPDPCDYCDCDDVDQGTHRLGCPNEDPNFSEDDMPDFDDEAQLLADKERWPD